MNLTTKDYKIIDVFLKINHIDNGYGFYHLLERFLESYKEEELKMKKQKLIQGKDYVKITIIRLIKKHDLSFIPKKITVSTDGIILWR